MADGPPPPRGVIACRPQHPTRPTVTKAPAGSEVETVAAGSMPGSFAVTSTGEASFVMPLVTVPGRAGVEPQIALAYNSSDGDGVLGRGFSITGTSAITRCPSNLSMDGEIRGVRYDSLDQLCLDSKRLVRVGEEPGRIFYRTLPDTQVKVIGHDPDEDGMPGSFEVFTPKGLVISYGTSEVTRPRGPKGAPRAWLAAVARDGRGRAIDFGYCFAEASDHTAEFALDEIRYTQFEGSPALEATRAVKLVYGLKDPADIRTIYSGGIAIQSSLQLNEIQMVGPGEELVRRYAFDYSLSPTTHCTLLSQVEECAGDGVCKPPTRFQYKSDPAGFKRIETSIAAPTSVRASPMLFDFSGDGLVDLVVPDTNPALSTPQNPITQWHLAKNLGESASPPFFANPTLAFSQEWPIVADPVGPSDSSLLQPELGTAIDYDQDGRSDVLLHDVYGGSVHEAVLLAQPNGTFDFHDTGIRRPFSLGDTPEPPELTSPGASVHLADLNGDGVADRISCEDHGVDVTDVPGEQGWRAHLWRPKQDTVSAGFDPTGEKIAPLAGTPCNMHLYTVDLDGDRKIELVVPRVITIGGTSQVETLTYKSLSRLSEGVMKSSTRCSLSGGKAVASFFLTCQATACPTRSRAAFRMAGSRRL